MSIRYKEKLQKKILELVLIPVVGMFFVFSIIIVLFSQRNETSHLNTALKETKMRVDQVVDYYAKFLENPEQLQMMQDFLEGKVTSNELTRMFRNDSMEAPVRANLLLLDAEGDLVYYSGNRSMLSAYQLFYYKLVNKNGKKVDGLVSRVIKLGDGIEKQWILENDIKDKTGTSVGGAFILISNTTLKNYFLSLDHDAIVESGDGTVVVCTNDSLLDNNGKFTFDGRIYTKVGDISYLVNSARGERFGGILYVVMRVNNLTEIYFFGIWLITLITIVLVMGTRRITKVMVAESTKSLDVLYGEMGKVKENLSHRLDVRTDDEFSEIADGINIMLEDIEVLSKKNVALEKLKGEMEMEQLKAKFQPHFIYNTLEGLRFAIMMKDTDQVDQVILSLTSLLRYSTQDSPYITLEEDMEHIKEYLNIMNFRVGGKIFCDFDIAEDTYQHLVPKLFIQPLLENSIKYEKSEDGIVIIHVKTWKENGMIHIVIKDEGKGIAPDMMEMVKENLISNSAGSSHFGVNIVAANLRNIYGKDSEIVFESKYGEGVKTELIMREKVE